MHTYEIHAYEGFCEDLARQTTVTHLSQLQLGSGVVTCGLRAVTYGLCAITYGSRVVTLGYVLSHMGFSHHCSVLKATI
jgi:hypothetical protein